MNENVAPPPAPPTAGSEMEGNRLRNGGNPGKNVFLGKQAQKWRETRKKTIFLRETGSEMEGNQENGFLKGNRGRQN